MKDYFDKSLDIGDKVVFALPRFATLTEGKIISFDNKKVIIEFITKKQDIRKTTKNATQTIKIDKD